MPAAPDESASILAEQAIARGLITGEQAQEALEVMAKMEELGVPEDLGRVLVKKGFISDAQLNQLEAKVTPKQPTNIGGFEIISRLGRGGMGAVYKARQVSLDRIVALKVLPPVLARDKDFIERFFREARAVAKLNHPNIVQGIDVGVAEKFYYFAMEYVDGEPVQRMLAREGPLDEKRALDITLQVAQALHHAHRHDMIHRDIKPDNIMVTSGGVTKLCDLGLAKSLTSDSGVTQAGMAVGTPHYISPEQARGEQSVDIRSDIYSLGATLYHMVVGRTPYSGSSAAVVMTKHINDEVPNPRDVRPEISMGLVRLVEKMMAKDPKDRYQTPEDLIRDVNLIISGKSPAALRLGAGRSAVRGFSGVPGAARARGHARRTTTRPVEPVPAKRSPAVLIAIGAGILLVAALGIGLGLYFKGGDDDDKLPPPKNGNGQVVKKNGNEPDPAEVKRKKRLQKLEDDFNGICRDWQKNPLAFRRIEQNLNMLKTEATGTVWALRADEKVREVQDGWKKYCDAEFDKALKRAEKLVAAGRFGAAIKAFSNLPVNPDLMRRATNQQRRIEALAAGRYRAIKTAAWKMLSPAVYQEDRKGDLAGAEKHLRTALAFKVASVNTKVNSELGRLRAEHKKRLDDLTKRMADVRNRELRKLRKDFRDWRGKVFAEAAVVDGASKLFKFGGAGKMAGNRLLHRRFKPFEAEAKRIQRDLAALEKFQQDLPAKFEAHSGKSVTVAAGSSVHKGSLEDVESYRVGLHPRGYPPGAKIYVNYADMLPANLAGHAGLDAGKPADAYLAGLLAFYSGRKGPAVESFRTAAKDAKLKADAQYYLTLSQAAYKAAREAEADEVLKKCRALYERLKAAKIPKGDPQWAILKEQLDLLMKGYADTEVVKSNPGK